MFHIYCDGKMIHDVRIPNLIVGSPTCSISANAAGDASFTLYPGHLFYSLPQKLKSTIEIINDGEVLFRGRVIGDSKNFRNEKIVSVEGALSFLNDSVIRPFNFPQDSQFEGWEESQNIIEFFLSWLLAQHNAQVGADRQLNVGIVTVQDANNYIVRSREGYASTLDILKDALYGSSLGGYVCVRYEEDGTYIDYVEEMLATSSQRIVFGENLIDLLNETDATETYTAMIPLGAEVENDDGTKTQVTIESLEDGEADDIAKSGDMLTSISGVENYGFVCAPVSATTWKDITTPERLLTAAKRWLKAQGYKFSQTIKVNAIDLHLTDADIEAIKPFSKVSVSSPAHGLVAEYAITEISYDLTNPQNNIITLGSATRSLTSATADVVKSASVLSTNVQKLQSKSDIVAKDYVTLKSSVEQNAEKITAINEADYMTLNSFGEWERTTFSTTATQSAEAFDIAQQHNDVISHITVEGGSIKITASDSIIYLRIENDQIAFYNADNEKLAYFSGDAFRINDNFRFSLGNLAIVPQANGSVSFIQASSME